MLPASALPLLFLWRPLSLSELLGSGCAKCQSDCISCAVCVCLRACVFACVRVRARVCGAHVRVRVCAHVVFLHACLPVLSCHVGVRRLGHETAADLRLVSTWLQRDDVRLGRYARAFAAHGFDWGAMRELAGALSLPAGADAARWRWAVALLEHDMGMAARKGDVLRLQCALARDFAGPQQAGAGAGVVQDFRSAGHGVDEPEPTSGNKSKSSAAACVPCYISHGVPTAFALLTSAVITVVVARCAWSRGARSAPAAS